MCELKKYAVFIGEKRYFLDFKMLMIYGIACDWNS
jgi:hypothetical protein